MELGARCPLGGKGEEGRAGTVDEMS